MKKNFSSYFDSSFQKLFLGKVAIILNGFFLTGFTYLFFGRYYVKLGLLFLTGIIFAYYLFKIFKCTRQSIVFSLTSCLLVTSFLVQGWILTWDALALIGGTLIWYYAIQLFVGNKIESIFILLLIVLGLNNLPGSWNIQLLTIIISVVFSCFLILKNQEVLRKIKDDYFLFLGQPSLDLVCWFILFLCTIFLGFQTKEGFCAIEGHPVYELSIAQSYKNNFINAPDLSYSGKVVRYHFFATKIPFYFGTVFNNSSLLSMVFFLSKLFLLCLMFLLLNTAVFSKKIPLMLLFFTPFLFSKEIFASVFKLTVNLTLSFFLANILLPICIYFFIEKKHVYFFISTTLLLLVKGSFYIPLVTGVMLFFLRERAYKKMMIWGVGLGGSFILLYYLFLRESHVHNLWIMGPFIGIYSLLSRSTSSYLVVLNQLVLFCYCLWLYYKNDVNSKEEVLAASIVMAGILGAFCMVEVQEGNQYHFYTAIFIPLAIVLWNFLQRIEQFFLRGKFKIRNVLLNGGWYFLFIFFCFNVNRPFLMGVSYMKNIFRGDDIASLKKDVEDAYTFLGRHQADLRLLKRVSLFGKHYEFDQNRFSFQFAGSSDNIRSAISGVQTYNENIGGKGVLMQPDYVDRFINNVLFYKKFIQFSDCSRTKLEEAIKDLEDNSVEALPLSKSTREWGGFRASILHTLSFGKEWFGQNRLDQIKYEIVQELKKRPKMTFSEGLTFLKEAKIGYIILELEDQPTEYLRRFTTKIFNNAMITILKVDQGLLEKLLNDFNTD